MAKDWIARRNGFLSQQARVFSQKIAADPGLYGIDPTEAAQLVAESEDFTAKYEATVRPGTRTSIAISGRDEARRVLTDHMRLVALRIRGNRAVTDEMRINLTMTVDGSAEPAPAGVPKSSPQILVGDLRGNYLTIRLSELETASRGMPRQYRGAQIFMYADDGTKPPGDIAQWRLLGVVSKAKSVVTLPYLPPGTKVTLAARWFNRHGAGPASMPVEVWTGQTLPLPGLQAA